MFLCVVRFEFGCWGQMRATGIPMILCGKIHWDHCAVQDVFFGCQEKKRARDITSNISVQHFPPFTGKPPNKTHMTF